MYYKAQIQNIEVIVTVIYDYSSVVLEVQNKEDIEKLEKIFKEQFISTSKILPNKKQGYLRVFENIGNLKDLIKM